MQFLLLNIHSIMRFELKDDESTANDNYELVQAFLERFPEFRGYFLVFDTFSYAGESTFLCPI